jgi:hypothetical protein
VNTHNPKEQPIMISLILAALSNTVARFGVDYFARPTGSYVAHDLLLGTKRLQPAEAIELLQQLAADGAMVEVTDDAREAKPCPTLGSVRYFRAELPAAFVGFEAVTLISDLDDDQLAQVRVVRTHKEHTPGVGGGVELVLPEVPPREVSYLHIAVGNDNPYEDPTEDGALVYFFAPGRLTGSVDVFNATVKGAD